MSVNVYADADAIIKGAIDREYEEVRLEARQELRYDMYYANIVAMRLHPGFGREYENKSFASLYDCAMMALEMLEVKQFLLEDKELIMGNHFNALVRMLELRLTRQELSVQETKAQLAAARVAAQVPAQEDLEAAIAATKSKR